MIDRKFEGLVTTVLAGYINDQGEVTIDINELIERLYSIFGQYHARLEAHVNLLQDNDERIQETLKDNQYLYELNNDLKKAIVNLALQGVRNERDR